MATGTLQAVVAVRRGENSKLLIAKMESWSLYSLFFNRDLWKIHDITYNSKISLQGAI